MSCHPEQREGAVNIHFVYLFPDFLATLDKLLYLYIC